VGPVLVIGLILKLGVLGWLLMGVLLLAISLVLTPAVRAATAAAGINRRAAVFFGAEP